MKLKMVAGSKNIHVPPHQVYHAGPMLYRVVVQGVGVVKEFTTFNQAVSYAVERVRCLEYEFDAHLWVSNTVVEVTEV